MEAVHPPIVQDATAHPVQEKEAIGIGRENEKERGNIVTRTDIAHAPTPTDTKERGVFTHCSFGAQLCVYDVLSHNTNKSVL